MNEFELIARTFMGLEPVLAKELTQMGANNVQIGRRMVSFTGDKGNDVSREFPAAHCYQNSEAN